MSNNFVIEDFCKFGIINIPRSNIFSLSIFKLDQGYKNFDKYLDGLELLAREIPKKFKKFIIILFFDKSIKDQCDIYNRIKKLVSDAFILIEYTCPQYIQNGKHIELFGTLIRFLPFFEFQENLSKMVISFDADAHMDDIELINIDYKFLKKFGSQYHYNTNLFYEMSGKWALLNDYSILAGRHMCKAKLPLDLLTNFLACIKNKSCKNYDTITKIFDYNKYSAYPYGIDEYFLNYVMLPYIKKTDILYSVTVRYMITAPLFYLFTKNIKFDTNALTIMMRTIFEKPKTDKTTYMQFYKEFDCMFFDLINGKQKNVSPRHIEIATRYYNEIYDLYKNKNYDIFSKSILKKILKYRNNTYIFKNSIIVYQGNNMIHKYVIGKL